MTETVVVKQLFDERLIVAFVSDPTLFNSMMDDMPCSPEDLQPSTESPGVKWLGVYVDNGLVGLWYLNQLNCITWQIHVAYTPKVWGTGIPKRTVKIALDKAFEVTRAKKMYANIPTTYAQVVAFAKAGGMKIEGTCKRNWQKNGQIYDTYHMGVYR